MIEPLVGSTFSVQFTEHRLQTSSGSFAMLWHCPGGCRSHTSLRPCEIFNICGKLLAPLLQGSGLLCVLVPENWFGVWWLNVVRTASGCNSVLRKRPATSEWSQQDFVAEDDRVPSRKAQYRWARFRFRGWLEPIHLKEVAKVYQLIV